MSRNRNKNHKLKRRLRLAHHDNQCGKCAYCNVEMDIELNTPDGKQKGNGLTLEHLLPQRYGGKNKMEETVGICANCNRKRSHRPLHWSIVWKVMQLKPKELWWLILKLHLINLWGFYHNSLGYKHLGSFKVQEYRESNRAKRRKAYIERCKAYRQSSKLSAA